MMKKEKMKLKAKAKQKTQQSAPSSALNNLKTEIASDFSFEIDTPLSDPRKEAFANYYFQTMNASEAYRNVYPSSHKWQAKTIAQKANKLKNDRDIQARVKYLKSELQRQCMSRAIATREEIGAFFTQEMRNDESIRAPLLNNRGLPIITSDGKAVMVDVPHVSRIKAASELMKLMGYEAPKKVEVQNGGYSENYKGPPALANLSTEELFTIAKEAVGATVSK